MQFHMIILSGGSGSRMGNEQPKQFLNLLGRPVLSFSAECFASWEHTASLTVVAHPEHIELTQKIVYEWTHRLPKSSLHFANGGSSRHRSTLNALECVRQNIEEDDLILIHDAARPAVSETELNRLAEQFKRDSAVDVVSLVSPITDTVIQSRGMGFPVERILDRSELFAVKTPQAFRAKRLNQLIATPEDPSFTDLLSWGMAAGLNCFTSPADTGNIKLTTPGDVLILERILTVENEL